MIETACWVQSRPPHSEYHHSFPTLKIGKERRTPFKAARDTAGVVSVEDATDADLGRVPHVDGSNTFLWPSEHPLLPPFLFSLPPVFVFPKTIQKVLERVQPRQAAAGRLAFRRVDPEGTGCAEANVSNRQ